ncbi:MAG: hypothetical protein GXP03_11015 [Alphaproteobacteria bacterium]|nr:hypothetical protein [Alphaproteobacteria bacterium]
MGYFIWSLPAAIVMLIPYLLIPILVGDFQQRPIVFVFSMSVLAVMNAVIFVLVVSPVLKAYFDLVRMCGIFGQRAAHISPEEIQLIAARMNAEYRSGYRWILGKIWPKMFSVDRKKANGSCENP